MERGSKRKAAGAISPVAERATKRQKTPLSSPYGETPEEIEDNGQRYVARVREAKDNKDNLIAIDFLTLPSRAALPDYYAQTSLPIALDTIEAKVKAGQYPSTAAVERDAKRMIQNAKDYNEPSSSIYSNAERLRKITFNFMKQNNPAYSRDPNYVSQPTPLPPAGQQDIFEAAPTSRIRLKQGKDQQTEPAAIEDHGQQDNRKPASTSAAPAEKHGLVPGEDGYDASYKGKSYQEAQEQLILETIHFKDEGGDLQIFLPFVTLPSRKLTDYYRTIKEPTSLNRILKKVKGVRSRDEVTGQTDFRTWDSLEEGVSKIWENARSYNDDESEIYILSQELETYFKERLSAAKECVNEPPQPTLKLNMKKQPAASGIKLRLGGGPKDSPAPSQARTSATPAAPIEDQKPATNVVSTPAPQTAPLPVANGIKPDASPSTMQLVRPTSQHSTTQPQGPAKMTNGTTHPPHAITFTHPHPHPSPQTNFDDRFRQEGKDASTALLTHLQITAHPLQPLPPSQKKLNILLPASDVLTQQTVTLNLSGSQTHIQLFPAVSSFLQDRRDRPYRLFVTHNGVRLNASGATGPPAPPGLPAGARQGPPTGPVAGYDVRLTGGMNRIEVECVAVAEGALGAGTLAGKGGLEREGFGVFVHSLRG